MKHAKSAALVAGSMMALGTAAPAFAAEAAEQQPQFSLNGGINQGLEHGLNNDVTQKQLDGSQLAPLTSPLKSAVGQVKGGLEQATQPVGKASAALESTAAPLLGGMPVR